LRVTVSVGATGVGEQAVSIRLKVKTRAKTRETVLRIFLRELSGFTDYTSWEVDMQEFGR
jgi:hypothetical protein